MKKLVTIAIVVGVIGVLSVGAYAYYGHRGDMYGPRGGMMSGPGWMQGRGPASRWNPSSDTCPCGAHGPGGWSRWNAPNQPGATQQASQMITEAKAKEVAEEYVNKYLPSYTIDKIEKDSWRPLYFVTIKGANDVVQQLTIHGLAGQVMHVFPLQQPAE